MQLFSILSLRPCPDVSCTRAQKTQRIFYLLLKCIRIPRTYIDACMHACAHLCMCVYVCIYVYIPHSGLWAQMFAREDGHACVPDVCEVECLLRMRERSKRTELDRSGRVRVHISLGSLWREESFRCVGSFSLPPVSELKTRNVPSRCKCFGSHRSHTKARSWVSYSVSCTDTYLSSFPLSSVRVPMSVACISVYTCACVCVCMCSFCYISCTMDV